MYLQFTYCCQTNVHVFLTDQIFEKQKSGHFFQVSNVFLKLQNLFFIHFHKWEQFSDLTLPWAKAEKAINKGNSTNTVILREFQTKVRVSLIVNPHFRFWFLIKHASAQHSGHSLTEVRCVTSSTNFSVRSCMRRGSGAPNCPSTSALWDFGCCWSLAYHGADHRLNSNLRGPLLQPKLVQSQERCEKRSSEGNLIMKWIHKN